MFNLSKLAFLLLRIIPIAAGFIIARIGFKGSQPIVMVMGLFISGVCLILFIKRIKFKMIALLVTFALCPLVAVAWSLVHQFDVDNLNSIEYSLSLIAQKEAQHIDSWFEAKEQGLNLAGNLILSEAGTSQISAAKTSYIRTLLKDLQQTSNEYRKISLLDPSGKVLVSTDAQEEKRIMDITNSNRLNIIRKSDTSGKSFVLIAMTIKNNSKSFIITAELDLPDISTASQSVEFPRNIPGKTVKVFAVDNDGNFITGQGNQPNSLTGSKINLDTNAYLLEINNRKMFYNNFEGNRVVGAYHAAGKSGWYVVCEQDYSEIISSVHEKSFMDPFIMLIITFLVVILFTTLFSFGLSRPILQLKKLMLKGAKGDLSVKFIKSKLEIIKIKEIDEMALAFNNMFDTIKNLNDSLETRIREQTQITDDLKEANYKLNSQQEEMKNLNSNLTASNSKLEHAFDELRETHSYLIQHENQIIGNIKQISELSENILANMNESSDSVEQGDISVNQTSNQMQNISIRMKTLSEFIENLNLQSKNIDAVNETITYIANQTRFLALNATIESAKAGSAGQGFSVIAEEINKLSSQSSNASKQISGLIRTVIESIEIVVNEMKDGTLEVNKGLDYTSVTKKSFERMKKSILDINSSLQEISAVTEDIAHGSEDFGSYLIEARDKLI